MFGLQGETALITGASSGLGHRFAVTLARAGAKVAIAARRTDRLNALEREIAGFGGRALALKLDVTDPASIAAAVDAAETELGALSILINNAGVARPKWIADTTPEDYADVMDTNLKGAWLTAQAVGRRMIQHRRGGKIVNIASMAAFKVLPQLAVYAMAKAALVQMTKAMALEWARYAIRVNAIAPGYIETEMNSEFFKTEAGRKTVQAMPRRRLGQPADLDGTLLLLASSASDYVTGTVITVDDGQTLL
ncbi:MAG: glucose 1-dehydrogenase [Alphaproteobacteria bacterium]|nr:glucose 1-dehydrogenase [Alphaproteobacteria bacterium]